RCPPRADVCDVRSISSPLFRWRHHVVPDFAARRIIGWERGSGPIPRDAVRAATPDQLVDGQERQHVAGRQADVTIAAGWLHKGRHSRFERERQAEDLVSRKPPGALLDSRDCLASPRIEAESPHPCGKGLLFQSRAGASGPHVLGYYVCIARRHTSSMHYEIAWRNNFLTPWNAAGIMCQARTMIVRHVHRRLPDACFDRRDAEPS